MGKDSKVQWTDASHGFWRGCQKVSAGCAHCYAERTMGRFGMDFEKVVRAKGFSKPLSWKGTMKVFVNPWSDFFIEDADQWRDEAWDIIRRTPNLTYQILTKRPERVKRCLPSFWDELRNVWLGVTVEDDSQVGRIRIAANVNPVVLFVSVEPMLGPVSLSGFREHRKPDWIICGGESGPGFRNMNINAAIALKDQCRLLGIPFFFKQISGVTKRKCAAIPSALMVREFPKYSTGA